MFTQLPKEFGSFQLKQEEKTIEEIEKHVSKVVQDIKNKDLIEKLTKYGFCHDVVAGYNTVIYYEWEPVPYETLGGAVFVNVELRDDKNPNYYLTVYSEYDGNIEEYGYQEYKISQLDKLVHNFDDILTYYEEQFTEIDKEMKLELELEN